MPVPVFTTGEVLTAANMNAVGLWRVTGCTVSSVGGTAATASNGVITIGTGNTSVTVSNAFSSDYDNYKIIYNIDSASVQSNLLLSFNNATGSTYYTVGSYYYWGSAVLNNYGPAATTNVLVGTTFASDTSAGVIEVLQPNKTKRTYLSSQSGGNAIAFVATNGLENSSNSHTGFTLFPSSGTLTGGKIRVYGYRN